MRRRPWKRLMMHRLTISERKSTAAANCFMESTWQTTSTLSEEGTHWNGSDKVPSFASWRAEVGRSSRSSAATERWKNNKDGSSKTVQNVQQENSVAIDRIQREGPQETWKRLADASMARCRASQSECVNGISRSSVVQTSYCCPSLPIHWPCTVSLASVNQKKKSTTQATTFVHAAATNLPCGYLEH